MGPNDSLNVSGADDVISAAEDVSAEYTTGQMITIGVIVSIVMTFIVLGSTLVIILYVLGKRIKKPRNAFIVSLAVSDVMVGTTIMPFSLSNELLGYWAFGETLCDLWLAFDVIACTASIYNLCAIALDRYWSVTDASYVQYKSRDRMKCMLAAVWVSAIVVGLPPLFGWKEEHDWAREAKPFCELRTLPEYVFFSVALSFWAPLLVMTVLYFMVLRETKMRFAARLQRRKISEEVTRRYAVKRARRSAVSRAKAADIARKASVVDSSKDSNANRCNFNAMAPGTPRPIPKRNQRVLVKCSPVQDAFSVSELSDFNLDILYEAEEIESKPKAQSNTFKVVSHVVKGSSNANASPSGKTNLHDCEGIRNKFCSDAPKSPGLNGNDENKVSSMTNSLEEEQNSGVKVGCMSMIGRPTAPNLKQETRLNMVIGLVMGTFAACWLPFFVVYPLSVVTESFVPAILFKFCFWLGYCNSFLNPIIYTAFNQDFREACTEVYRKFCQRTREGR
ncbi:alpha-2 adrenergic receptor-like [Branchiostoma floridae x Branchiostoma belcheri]